MQFREYFGFEPKHELVIPVNQVATRADEDGNPSPAILPPPRDSACVSAKQASEIGTVFRAVNIISTSLSQMPLEVFRDGQKIRTPYLIQNPIEGESQSSFVQQVVWSLALWGNAYVRIWGEGLGQRLEVLDPDAVTVVKRNGKVRFFVPTETNEGYVQTELDAKKVRHLKFERMPGALLGIGPMHGAKGEIKAAYLLDKFQSTWFDTTGIPKGVLTVPGQMNAQQSAEFTKRWNEFIKSNEGTGLLPNGMDFKVIESKPAELQYIDVAEANIRNIARIFGIPAANLLSAIEGTSMTYTNQIESNISFMQNTLSRYMNEIEFALSDLLPRSQKVEFNTDELLRMAPEKQWAVKKTQFDVGYYDGAEQRKNEGLPALPKKEVVKPETENKANTNKDNEQNDN